LALEKTRRGAGSKRKRDYEARHRGRNSAGTPSRFVSETLGRTIKVGEMNKRRKGNKGEKKKNGSSYIKV